jgi:hypothetical protein
MSFKAPDGPARLHDGLLDLLKRKSLGRPMPPHRPDRPAPGWPGPACLHGGERPGFEGAQRERGYLEKVASGEVFRHQALASPALAMACPDALTPRHEFGAPRVTGAGPPGRILCEQPPISDRMGWPDLPLISRKPRCAPVLAIARHQTWRRYNSPPCPGL